jgi:hypothetical protein
MPLNDTALDVMANALKSAATHASLHSANPGTTGTNETTAGRQAIVWDGPSTGGDLSLQGTESFTGGAANGACTYVGLWSASSGGTFYGGFALTGDQTFNAAGEYTLTEVNLTGTAS